MATTAERQERYRELLEKTDPSIKKRRLLEELNGREPGPNQDESQRIIGLREELFGVARQATNQDTFVKLRLDERKNLSDDETTDELWERDQAIAEYTQSMLWMRVEYLDGLVRAVEADLEKIGSAGVPQPATRSARGARRRAER